MCKRVACRELLSSTRELFHPGMTYFTCPYIIFRLLIVTHCVLVAENTLKRLANSTHSLSPSPYVNRNVQSLKLAEVQPRKNSVIYHDSDENMVSRVVN